METMKREFKFDDRVLVRNNDLDEWQAGILIKQHNDRSHPFYVCLEESHRTFMWSQCRHIDEFRTGDKVQVSDDGKNWEDATYLGYIEVEEDYKPHPYKHVATTKLYHSAQHKFCRWHPSMPWANKEEIIDEPHWIKTIFRRLDARLDAIELKLNEK